MLEVRKNIAPCGEMLPDARDHSLMLLGRVTGLAVSVIGVAGSDNIGSVALLGLGLIGIGGMLRRKKLTA